MSDGRMEMSSIGIMTLTRTPCELDKMSLFQDLKLKRRKVDSRCSSDGESVADTSTSSPDLVSPASPKMSENVPSPDSTPRAESLGGAGEATLVAEEPAVFDGGGGGGGLGGGGGGGGLGVGVGVGVGVSIVGSGVQSVIRAVPRALSPPAPRPALAATPPQPPRPHSSPVRHSPEAAKLSPLVTAARSSPAPPPRHSPSVITSQQQAVTQLWAQSSRINGVKPELIGGSFSPVSLLSAAATMKPPLLGRAPSGPVAPPLRQTPTVIMGEAGGVRTMIWSAPAAPAAATVAVATQDTHPSTSACWPATAPNPEESAAHMLLNLGGTHEPARVRPRPPTRPPPPFGAAPLNMERLWAGDPAQPGLQALNLTAAQQYAPRPPLAAPTAATAADVKLTVLGEQAAPAGGPSADSEPADDDDQPMICMICEDKATGLHYGIITCEGCKGFFKRTVQNRRVYTCVADGNCEITKAQRNRCQYCRFKKCIEQGMVLQAVREDRMPGGRNSGAVYNLYKVKYKKHKKTGKQAQQAAQQQQQQAAQAAAAKQVAADKALVSVQVKSEPQSSIPAHLVNGTILKTALTNPSEVVHLRQRLDNAVSSSRDRSYPIENTLSMIQTLIDCDEFQDIATLQNLDELLDHKSDLNEKLCQIGDSIVYKLVQWTKRLPFYLELPVEVHTRLLTHKWHELLVLTTSAYQAIHGQAAKSSHSHPHQQPQPPSSPADANVDPDFTQEKIDEVDFNQQVSTNLCTLQSCLTSMMGRPITIDQLRQDVGLMVEKITQVTLMFRRIRLTMEEYVCLKVITMLHQARPGGMSGSSGGASSGGGSAPGGSELEAIQERYMTCLRAYTHHACPQQPGRYHELLVRLPEVQSAAALLLESKMFYVPFLLNSAIQR